jgi:hypothetical protein
MTSPKPDAVSGKRIVLARTLKAYRRARYETAGVQVYIGRRSPAMDRLLSSCDAREAVFLTAYNPFSRVMPAGWNRRMQAHLAQTVRRHRILPATGSWRHWSEAHLVVFGDPRPARRLARRYRQNAIVVVRIRQPARLVVTS